MLLTFSIGNREITLGFIRDGELVDTATVSYIHGRTCDEYACIIRGVLELHKMESSAFDGAIGASVVPSATETVRKAIETLLGIRVHMLGTGTKTGLNILIDDPTQLGGDLVAASVGALAKYKPPMILVDFGVATTFSVIDQSGAFIGCAIAPGISLSREALSAGASLLPSVANTAPKKCIGTNTAESMQSGSIFGSAAMVDGMISRMEEELDCSTTVIASGGSTAEHITANCKREIIRDDTLLLTGLATVYMKNQRKHK